MQAVTWWLIPVVATAGAITWVWWRSRPRPPADPHDTLAEHQRFREAMENDRRPPRDESA